MLEPYVELLEDFVGRRISAAEFERRYLERFKEDPARWPEEQFQTLDSLFADIDAFCADPALRDEGDLDEPALLRSAEKALRRLRALSK